MRGAVPASLDGGAPGWYHQGQRGRERMKRLLIPLLLCLLACGCALAETAGDYLYEPGERDGCVITGYTGPGGALTLPAELDGLRVRGIADGAFQGCGSITAVDLSACTTEIGERAFADCPALAKVVLSGGTASLAPGAFENCVSLTEIRLPESLFLIEERAFAGCTALEKVDLTRVAAIGEAAFQGCAALKDVALGEALMSLGAEQFLGCTSLRKVEVPAEVVYVGARIFDGCTALEKVWMPPAVDFIGEDAFRGCDKLTIYGQAGTKAETFAAEQGIPFSTSRLGWWWPW